jgi:hypothetical protein
MTQLPAPAELLGDDEDEKPTNESAVWVIDGQRNTWLPNIRLMFDETSQAALVRGKKITRFPRFQALHPD